MLRLPVLSLLALPVFSLAQGTLAPPVAPVKPVTDTYFGTTVVDPYRWMETSTDELQDYMRAENAVTQQALAPFRAQDETFLAELTKLSTSWPMSTSLAAISTSISIASCRPAKAISGS